MTSKVFVALILICLAVASYFGALWIAPRVGITKRRKMAGEGYVRSALAMSGAAAVAVAAAWIFTEGWIIAGMIVVVVAFGLPGTLAGLAQVGKTRRRRQRETAERRDPHGSP